MAQLYANNAATSLAASIVAGDTSATVQTGAGTLLPSPTGGNFALLTLQNGTTIEIVKLTARSGDVLTIVRAQEGTAASAFPAGSRVELRLTAGTLERFAQGTTLQTLGDPYDVLAVDAAGTNAEWQLPYFHGQCRL